MTNKEISKYINRLNQGKGQESIFTREISESVVVAKVWSEQPKKTDSIVGNFASYRFFFIKNSMNVYVGAVLDMGTDLHWYISPKYRKRGYLTTALKESILPYVFENDRNEQRITIENGIGKKDYNNSRKVAEKLGFVPINIEETEFLLKESMFGRDNARLTKKNKTISKDRIEILTKRVNYATKELLKISDELTMAYDDDKNLDDISNEVFKYTWKIEDLWYKYK